MKLFAAVMVSTLLFVMQPALGAEVTENTDLPVTLSADEISYDQERNTVTARGNVEIVHDERTLLADSVIYDQERDGVKASGKVVLMLPTGEVIFSEYMAVSGDLKNGIIDDFHAIMADRSRFAAKRAELVNDETMTLSNAVYSPCKACEKDPTRPPLWQVKAVKVIHDRKRKMVEYKDAWMEFYGVPVAYIPYLSYPDPTVKRKTGLLPPSFGGSSDLGFTVRQPFFYVIDDQRDMTFTPILTAKEGSAMVGEYRQRMGDGEYKIGGSYAKEDTSGRNLGHVAAYGRFDINDTWRWGADINRTWGDTYMRRYDLGGQDTLTSRAFVEGFRGPNYARVEGIAFQGLEEDDNPKTTPVVLPLAEFSHQGEPGKFGAYTNFDVNIAALTRETGTNSRRVSLGAAWSLPYIAPKGDIYKLTASVRTDVIHVNDQPYVKEADGTFNGAMARIYPQLVMDWRWPLAKKRGQTTEIIEPIAQIVLSPYGGNSPKIPNEDSQAFDFSDTNLFSPNRFTGYDRVEGGPRINYGVKWGLYGNEGGSTNIMLGQSYRLKVDDTFGVGTGLDDHFSDYVGVLKASPGDYLNLLYRTRLDKNSLDFKRSEVGVSGNISVFNYSSNYVFFDRQAESEFFGREEINYNLGMKLSDTWRTNLHGVRDLAADGGQRLTQLGFTYEDECFVFTTALSRTYYSDREVLPTDSIMVRMVFKTLGEVGGNIAAPGGG